MSPLSALIGDDRGQMTTPRPVRIMVFGLIGVVILLLITNEIGQGALVNFALAAEPYLEAALFVPLFVLVGLWMARVIWLGGASDE